MTREIQAVAGVVGSVVDHGGSGEAHDIQDCESECDHGGGRPQPRAPMNAKLRTIQFFSRCSRRMHCGPLGNSAIYSPP